jgi:hypothetical protein
MAEKEKTQKVYGDFQTPPPLAEAAIATLRRLAIKPGSVLEPTCGKGAFLLAAFQAFPEAAGVIGVDINAEHLQELRHQISSLARQDTIQLWHADFFSFDWQTLLNDLPQPILIVGNPPWVTSSDLGVWDSDNLPPKSNFQKRRGVEAITGKSNFDISEWMLLQHLDWLKNRRGVIAVLCKTAVARKVLRQAWQQRLPVTHSAIFLIDAPQHFGAAVDACFLVIDMSGGASSTDCAVYDDFNSGQPSQRIGYYNDVILSNVDLYSRWRHLNGTNKAYIWRSGIKHDCARVMEFEPVGDHYRNGTGELIGLEEDYLYPLLKSSDIGNGQIRYGRKYLLVTQKYVGEDTAPIRRIAPKTWRYLEAHHEALEKRASSIYQNRPKYSIFGVGDYSFANWKVAISGFYKRLSFKLIEPYQGKPVVLDDTTYFLPCWSQAEAVFISNLLNSKPAQEFLASMIFWADKRPITSEILKRLDLHALSIELGCEADYLNFVSHRQDEERYAIQGQLSLGLAEKKAEYSADRRKASAQPRRRTRRQTT